MLLAFGINLYLMHHYQLDRMPWSYLPTSAIARWVLDQLAVLDPLAACRQRATCGSDEGRLICNW